MVYQCSFNQLLVKQEDKVYLLGTVFSCGLIHIWGSNEYLCQQDGVHE